MECDIFVFNKTINYLRQEAKNELIINVNYIKSVNFNGSEILNFVPSEYSNTFLFDCIGKQYYQRPLMKITTENETITLSFEDDAPALEMYAKLREKMCSTSERPFFYIDINSSLYRVAHTL